MKLLAFLFLLSAAVWAIPLITKGRLANLIAVLFLVGTVFGPPFLAFDGPVQISIDRILLAGILVIAAAQWRLGKLRPAKLLRIDFCMLLLTGYLFLRSRGGDLVETEINPMGRWLFYIFVPLLCYTLSRLAPFRRRDFYRMLYALIALGGYLSFTAVCEVKGLHFLVYPKHILDPDMWMFFGRGRGPLLNPIVNGFIIGVAMSGVAACFVGASRHGKILLSVVAGVLLAGGYATLTRSCWIGVAAPIGIVMLIYSPRWARVLGVATVVLLSVALSMGLKDQILSLKRDEALPASDSAKSLELRPLLATVAWEMFKDKPIAGHGFGQYLQHSDQYHTIREYELPLDQVRDYSHHNVFIAFLVDSGLIGMGLYLAIMLILASQGWSMASDAKPLIDRRRAGLFALGVLGCYLPNAMFHDMTVIPMVQVILMGTAGMLVAIYEHGFAADSESVTERRQAQVASAVTAGG